MLLKVLLHAAADLMLCHIKSGMPTDLSTTLKTAPCVHSRIFRSRRTFSRATRCLQAAAIFPRNDDGNDANDDKEDLGKKHHAHLTALSSLISSLENCQAWSFSFAEKTYTEHLRKHTLPEGCNC